MKYLFLLFLIGCLPQVPYKVGDCIRDYGYIRVQDYIVTDIYKDKYVLSAVQNINGKLIVVDKTIFSARELADSSKKIKCSEVE
jgi:hypothetical protein